MRDLELLELTGRRGEPSGRFVLRMFSPMGVRCRKSYGVPATFTKNGLSGIRLVLTGVYWLELICSSWFSTEPEDSPPRLKYVWLVRLMTVSSVLELLIAV